MKQAEVEGLWQPRELLLSSSQLGPGGNGAWVGGHCLTYQQSVSCSVVSDSVRPQRRQPTHPWDSPGKNTGVGCHFFLQCMKVKSESEVSESCPTLSDPMDCGPPGSSIHGIFQARVLEWGAIAFSVLYSTILQM